MAADEQSEESSVVWESPNTPITPRDFILYDGKRFVRPYFFEFVAHVKERWNKKTVAHLFAEEFRQRPLQYYHQAVDAGRILVNGKTVKNDYVVRTSQTLSHFVHRHEPPVMNVPVEILDLSPDVITVCKPSSVPVHPCGQYRKNTVLGILQADHNLSPLYPIHRLDRLVSGLLILARNSHTADKFRQEIERGKVSKSYIAKVQGVFPDEVESNASIVYDPREGISNVKEAKEELERDALIERTVDKPLGPMEKGKAACTRFKRLFTDGVHSIVECMPLTGRTHQIRVHLQHLGHPIANDALYASHDLLKRTVAGTNAERAARIGVLSQEQSPLDESSTKRRRISKVSTRELEVSNELTSHGKGSSVDEKFEEKDGTGRSSGASSDDDVLSAGNGVEFVVDPMCTHCPNLWPKGYEGREHGLWLHCKRYSGNGWKYECPLPKWAIITP